MTTILYHNNTLLADSRTSRKASEGEGSDPAMKCVHCGEKAHNVRDNKIKIRIPQRTIKFRDEVIRAVAGAGEVVALENQLNSITTLEDYQAAYTAAFLMVGSAPGTIRCTLLVVTDKHVHVIHYRNNGLSGMHVDRHSLDETVAIGSGAVAAKTAIIAYKVDAFEAMRVASEVDKSTGGPIRYVDFSSKETKLEVRTYEPLEFTVPEVKQEEPPKATKSRATRKPTVEQTLTTAVQDLKKVVK